MTAKSWPPAPANRFAVDRRTLMRAGIFGLAAVPVPAMSAAFDTARGFTHCVASGEPTASSAMLWTRYRATSGDPVMLRFEVSAGMDFSQIVSGGDVETSPTRDWCAKPVATGLTPDRWYYYRFVAPDGEISPVGRTRTLPDGPTARWRMAVFSCSNLGFGWFNAYAHAADADEFDLALHLGDYLYEYQVGAYPSAKEIVPGRNLAPENEIVALADYRLRYAAYRADPDLQRVHQLYPFITVPDDHESANDSWKDGAQNHDPATEGSWDVRKAAAMQANREWLPVSDAMWASYDIGDLASIFRLETRLTARDKQFDLFDVVRGLEQGPQWEAALAAFREDGYLDPARTMMGPEQESWLASGMAESTSAGRRWQVLAQQVVMAQLMAPPRLLEDLPADLPENVRKRIERRSMLTRNGLPFNMDAWDGYPAARARLLAAAREAESNLVVLAGDTHNAWASELGGAGVEFAVQSVSSPGAERSIGWRDPGDLVRAAVETNEQLKWAEAKHRGYMAVELTPARATCEYRFMQTVLNRTTQLAGTHRMATDYGARRFTA